MPDPAVREGREPRAAWVDAARGIGIILVVYGHVLRGLVAARIVPAGGWAAAEDHLIYAFHMPLFFLVAGLFIERSLARGRGAFLADKLWTIVYPYILWSLVEGGIQIAARGSGTHIVIGWHDLLTIGWRPIDQFWFLYALFLSQLVAWASLPRLWLLLTLAALAAVASASVQSIAIWAVALPALPFVAGGVALARSGLLLAAAGWPAWRAGAVCGIAWIVFAALFLLWPTPASFPAYMVRFYLLAVAGCAGTLALACLLGRSAMLRALGRASMAIYVMHIIICAALRIALHRLVPAAGPLPHLLFGTALGLALPYLVWRTTQGTAAAAWLGFSRPLDRARATTPLPG